MGKIGGKLVNLAVSQSASKLPKISILKVMQCCMRASPELQTRPKCGVTTRHKAGVTVHSIPIPQDISSLDIANIPLR